MRAFKVREASSHRLKEAIVYIFAKHPEREFTLIEISYEVLRYFQLEDKDIPDNEIATFKRRLHEALAEKKQTGFIISRTAKNSIIKNYLLYKLGRT